MDFVLNGVSSPNRYDEPEVSIPGAQSRHELDEWGDGTVALDGLVARVARETAAGGGSRPEIVGPGLLAALGAREVILVDVADGESDGCIDASIHRFCRDGSTRRELLRASADLPWLRARRTRHDAVVVDPAGVAVSKVPVLAGMAAPGVRSLVLVPMIGDGRLVGGIAIACSRERSSWTHRMLEPLRLLGDLLAGATMRSRGRSPAKGPVGESPRLRSIPPSSEVRSPAASSEGDLVGRSPAFLEMMHLVDRVAATDTPVLLLGETGVGKGRIAKEIHARGRRRGREMVTLNCAALPPSLAESELFGREKGAYTGADARQIGRFEAADGSTLFLDELGEMPLELQAKFLRVLEDGSFQRLGSPRSLHADVRVVAATNRELDAEMAAGRLRRDLFYRLNVFPIRVPALRERREDIPLLADSIARRLARGLGRSFRAFDSGSMTRMLEYPWPGNVRELANVVERSLILCRSEEITVETGMLETGAPAPGARDDADDGSPRRERTLRAIERRHILSVMADCSWRVRGHGGAAEILDVVPTTLESLMHRLGIKRPG